MNRTERIEGNADSGHPSVEQLNAFAVGQLSEPAAFQVEQHLSVCTQCNHMLASSPNDSFVQLLQEGDTLMRGGALATAAPARPLRFVPGYTLLEQLGQGGMGVVWKARQDGLDRVVALKRLRSSGAPSAEALARFRREAESVARLHHANIVQIYEVGEQDNEPYLAMEYVAGGSLGQKMASGPLVPVRAAALVETLAGAIHHAHENGIVHRDLKPENILLDDHDAPKISDFGLAKEFGESSAHTQTGDIVGTPCYMAPEQAAGEKAAVGPAADVYALGAILYETLTGRPPFRGPTVLDTLSQVREREPVPPRQLQPKIPRDLETICLKCLHKEPRKRYAQAADLAADLRRFLNGQPVRARRTGFVERLVKWARRKPAWAALGGVSALALASLLGGGLWYQARLRLAVQQAQTNQERADSNYRHARQAINGMLNRLAQFQAPGVPQIEILRRELSKDALTFFERIAEAEADADSATRLDLARAYLLLGSLLGSQDQLEAARKSLDHAWLLLDGLCAEAPANLGYRFELSKCLEGLAVCVGTAGRMEECLRLREENLEVCQELCRLEPENADHQRALAMSHLNLGVSFSDRSELAELHWKSAARIFEKLIREHPDRPDDQYQLASTHSNLAMLYRDTGRIDEADAAYREVEPRLAKLVKEHPDRKGWVQGLVKTLWNWSGMLITARRGEEAAPLLDRGISIMDKWYLEDPQFPFVQQLLLACLATRMRNCTLLHRRDEGDKDWQRALALSARLRSWSELCVSAWLDADLGDYELAAARAEHLAKQKDLKGEDLYGLARAYAVAAEGARKDSGLATAERERKADGYAAEAVSLLRKLQKSGYFNEAGNLKNLLTDHDLDSLRSRDDFAKLVSGLTNKTRTSGK